MEMKRHKETCGDMKKQEKIWKDRKRQEKTWGDMKRNEKTWGDIKRDIKRQMRKPKINVWKEFFDFWPLSICVPAIFIIYMWGLFNY